MEKEIGRLREILRNSNYTVALCGSGMTEESGFIGIKIGRASCRERV